MYPIDIVKPMKEELTEVGYTELINTEDVDKALQQKGCCFVVINSVCGCAAGAARPAAIQIIRALEAQEHKPDAFYTTFAGYDVDALNYLRDSLKPYPPSSPAMALFCNGKLVHFLERHHIEGSTAEDIATNILDACAECC